MKTISKKRFNKLLKETILDFEYAGKYMGKEKALIIANNLKKIYGKDVKDLTVAEITPLVEVVIDVEIGVNMPPLSFEQMIAHKQIMKEHKEMLNYIRQFFDITVIFDGFINITKKTNNTLKKAS